MHIRKQIQALLISFGIVTMLFILLVSIGGIVIVQSGKANERIEHTGRVTSQINIIRTAFDKADIVAREFWVYGQNGDKVAPARAQLKSDLDTLLQMTEDNSNQNENIKHSLEAIQDYYNLQDELIQVALKSGYDAASRVARDKNTASRKENVSNAFTKLQAEETTLLGERSRNAESAYTTLLTVLIVIAIAMMLSIPGTFMVAFFTLAERNRIANNFRDMMNQARDEKSEKVVLPGDYGHLILAALESSNRPQG